MKKRECPRGFDACPFDLAFLRRVFKGLERGCPFGDKCDWKGVEEDCEDGL